MQRVIAIHDMSGVGKASLTVVIPILSVMGLTVSPLPTAVLSSITGHYTDYAFVDLTRFCTDTINHWRKLDLKVNWIYSGFLASHRQINIITDLIAQYPEATVVVDPVLGDNGRLYETMDEAMVVTMRDTLINRADILTPNYTEASFLLDGRYSEPYDMCRALAERGAKRVVITSAPNNKGQYNCVEAYCSITNASVHIETEYVPASYSGTGDAFASVLLGGLSQGLEFEQAVSKAVDFVYFTVKKTYETCGAKGDIVLESCLNIL